MIRCVIIDDERQAINVIKKHVGRLPNIEVVGTETNPLLGIELIKKEHPDVVFLDIQMDEMNGIEIMKLLGKSTCVVICTAYSEFAVTGYELDAVDYLMKPIEFNRFVKAVQRVSNTISHRSPGNTNAIPNDYIFVKAGQRGKMLKIDLDEIDYVEGMSNYIAFHRGTQKTLAYLTLRELEERLPDVQFIRVHKSYIIAIREISFMEHNELILKKSKQRIPIGANYKEAFLTKMKDKLME
jgi:DNA-binding LytR/AlgR family response regulator